MYGTLRLNINSLSSSRILTTFGQMFFQCLKNGIQDYILNWQLHTVACRRNRHRNKESTEYMYNWTETDERAVQSQATARVSPPEVHGLPVSVCRSGFNYPHLAIDCSGCKRRHPAPADSAVIISRPTNGTVQCSGKYHCLRCRHSRPAPTCHCSDFTIGPYKVCLLYTSPSPRD